MGQPNKQVELENLPDAFARLRQEYEQLLVKLETAEEETARAVEQTGRLEA